MTELHATTKEKNTNYEIKKYTYTTPGGRKPWFCITYLAHWELYGTDQMVEEVIQWMYDSIEIIKKTTKKQYNKTKIDLGDFFHAVIMHVPFDESLENKRSFLISEKGMATLAAVQLAMKYTEVINRLI